MKHLPIRIAYLVTGIFLCMITHAQEQEKHEISIYAASGLSTLQYDLKGGTRDNRIRGGVGLSYGFFFNDYWGITTGGELAYYYAKARMEPFSGGDYVQNNNFTYNYEVTNYHESHELVVISVPLMLQYQAPLLLKEHLCYAAIGTKFGFPQRLDYKTAGATYTTTGINHNDNSMIDAPESDGFGSFSEKRKKRHIGYKTSYILSAEVGMKWSLSRFFFLYTGIYCDYGLNDIVKGNTGKSFVSYNSPKPTDIQHYSILQSSFGQEGERISFADKVAPLALGLKIKFTFMPPGKCY